MSTAIAAGADKEGNVWELRRITPNNWEILKNGRHKTKRVTYALAYRYLLLMLRS